MEFNFNINNLLGETITKLDKNVNPFRRNAEGYDVHSLRSQLMTVIDRMGDASAKAQGLHTVITTGRKLQLSDHILYIMKDSSGQRGSVVGILKIGHKKLFVYDNHGAVNELEPMCVLDFYVHESRQRMGCGRQLFDFMLHDQGVSAQHLAIDKPSFKFSQFLNKHYHLRAEIPQVNNFVVFEGFFNNRSDFSKRKINGRPPQPPKKKDPGLDEGLRRQNTYNSYGLPMLPTNSQSNTGTRSNSRPGSGTSVLSGQAHSASVHNTPRGGEQDYSRKGQLRPISATKKEEEQRLISAQAHKSAGQQMYSRHIASSPIGSLPGSRPTSNTRLTSGAGSRAAINPQVAYADPPLLQRGKTTDNNYLQNMNLHQDYLGRGGHLKTAQPAIMKPVVRNPFLSREEEIAAGTIPWEPTQDKKSWTVFNKPPGYLTIAQRNYTHTRLW